MPRPPDDFDAFRGIATAALIGIAMWAVVFLICAPP